MSRLKAQWLTEHAAWRTRDLPACRYVYWWADGVYNHVRMDDKLCLLVIVGVTAQGRKELVAVEDGYRESEAGWATLLTGLRERGLKVAPRLATGDGALGFWAALAKAYPTTRGIGVEPLGLLGEERRRFFFHAPFSAWRFQPAAG